MCHIFQMRQLRKFGWWVFLSVLADYVKEELSIRKVQSKKYFWGTKIKVFLEFCSPQINFYLPCVFFGFALVLLPLLLSPPPPTFCLCACVE